MPPLTLTLPTDLLDRPLPDHAELPSFALTPRLPGASAIGALVEHMDRLAIEQLFLRVDHLLRDEPVTAIKLGYTWVIEEINTENEEVFPSAKVSLRWAPGHRPGEGAALNETVEQWLTEAMGMEAGAMSGGRVQVLRDLRHLGWIDAPVWHDTSRQLYTERFGLERASAWAASLERESLRQTLDQHTDPASPAVFTVRGRL